MQALIMNHRAFIASVLVAPALVFGGFALSSTLAGAQTPSPTPSTESAPSTAPSTPSTPDDSMAPSERGSGDKADCPKDAPGGSGFGSEEVREGGLLAALSVGNVVLPRDQLEYDWPDFDGG
jgi:hypothetical protein